jgi:site-specific DNA-cytosine methylase
MNSLELFSGAGGLAKGLELAGFKHAALVENNQHAYASLCENFDAKKVFLGDVRDFDLETLTNIDCDWSFPAETHSAERLFWDMYITEEYWERHKISKLERPVLDRSMEAKSRKLIEKYGMFEPVLKPWQTVRDAIHDLPDPQLAFEIADHIFHNGARSYPGHTGSILDAPAKTIKAGDHGVPGGENMIRFSDGTVRYLTVLEAKRLQTFPDDFVVEGVWGEAMRQIGNAVPVLLAEIMGREMMKVLTSHDRSMKSAISSNLEHRQLILNV